MCAHVFIIIQPHIHIYIYIYVIYAFIHVKMLFTITSLDFSLSHFFPLIVWSHSIVRINSQIHPHTQNILYRIVNIYIHQSLPPQAGSVAVSTDCVLPMYPCIHTFIYIYTECCTSKYSALVLVARSNSE